MKIVVMTPQEILFQGKAGNVILPGELGVFEILPGHKPLISRLLSGSVTIDAESITIRRGIVKVDEDLITVVVET